MGSESSKSKRHSSSRSKSSSSSKRSPKPSHPPTVVDWSEAQIEATPSVTQNKVFLESEPGKFFSPVDEFERLKAKKEYEESLAQQSIEPRIIEWSPRAYEESSRAKRQSRSSSSSKRSPKPSHPPSVVDWPEETIEATPPVTQPLAHSQSAEPELYGESGNKFSVKNRLPGEEKERFLKKELNNKYGKYSVEHGIDAQKTKAHGFGLGYDTDITYTPNYRTRDRDSKYTKGSEIDFVQSVRTGIRDSNGTTRWKTTAADHGYSVDESGQTIDKKGNPTYTHRADLTEQETGTGWRVDMTRYDTPFNHEGHSDAISGEGARHHFGKGKTRPVRLGDTPAIDEPGYVFHATTTAMDKKTGRERGTVRWGFGVEQDEQGRSILNTRRPTFLEDDMKLEGSAGEEARQWNEGRKSSYRRWNNAAPRKEEDNRRKGRPKEVTRIPGIN